MQQKVSVRRHLRYGVAGLATYGPAGGVLASGNIAYRFFQSYGQLEARMSQLAPAEEATLVGTAYGAVGFNSPNLPVVPGSVITVTLSDLPNSTQFAVPIVITYTVMAGDTLLSICGSLCAEAALNVNFTSAGGYAINDFGSEPYTMQVVPFPIASFICPKPFSITCTGAGNTVPQIVATGGLNPPVLYISETYPATPIYGYLPICDHLENAFLSTTNNLSISKAREATMRASELRERQFLYDQACLKLAGFLGVPLSPDNQGFRVSPDRSHGRSTGMFRI